MAWLRWAAAWTVSDSRTARRRMGGAIQVRPGFAPERVCGDCDSPAVEANAAEFAGDAVHEDLGAVGGPARGEEHVVVVGLAQVAVLAADGLAVGGGGSNGWPAGGPRLCSSSATANLVATIATWLGLRSRQRLWATYWRPAVEAVTREFQPLVPTGFSANSP